MDKELKKKWVDALRSGDYKQGRGHLRSARDAYCCLGVLAEISGMPNEVGDDGYYKYGTNGCNSGLFGRADQLRLGVASVVGYLVSMNDEANATFPEIADYIDENL